MEVRSPRPDERAHKAHRAPIMGRSGGGAMTSVSAGVLQILPRQTRKVDFSGVLLLPYRAWTRRRRLGLRENIFNWLEERTIPELSFIC